MNDNNGPEKKHRNDNKIMRNPILKKTCEDTKGKK